MLTGKQVRVKYVRDRIVPLYLDANDAGWLESAERLLALFRQREGVTRGQLESELEELFGDHPSQLVPQGLAKLLEDRCEFAVVSKQPPEEIREVVFRAAAEARKQGGRFERDAVLRAVAAALGLEPTQVADALFADLKSEQRLVSFRDLSAEQLLQRYNVALAQAVVLRAVAVRAAIRGEPPQRYRQLLRSAKFHRLVCDARTGAAGELILQLDGPLSLFSATQKYGLQLALFLPAVLLCRDFELTADLRWGPARKPKEFRLTSQDRLVSHLPDVGMYVPPELAMFADLFRKKIPDWELTEVAELVPLGDGYWAPDFRLTHRATGRSVLLEVLGFWRRASVEKHLARLRTQVKEPFLLAVSDQLQINEGELETLPAGIHRFRQMPLPDAIARLAEEKVSGPFFEKGS